MLFNHTFFPFARLTVVVVARKQVGHPSSVCFAPGSYEPGVCLYWRQGISFGNAFSP
jgi:hypothetical protein